MTPLQLIAIVIVTGCLTYFCMMLYSMRRLEGAVKRIIVRILIWLLVFGAFPVINILINIDWIPGKWMLRIRF